jgi:hypothetical protein
MILKSVRDSYNNMDNLQIELKFFHLNIDISIHIHLNVNIQNSFEYSILNIDHGLNLDLYIIKQSKVIILLIIICSSLINYNKIKK